MSAILIVDDHEQNRYLLRAMLTAYGDEVLEAANGVEALEIARRTRPDLIISDILMPQMDGFALCRACKRDEQLRHIPFLFYTATYTDPRDEALALQLGAARFIVKPVESEDFIAIVRAVRQAYAAGKLDVPPPPQEEETTFYRLYNEALIRKLEDKMLDLDRLNRTLAESEARFRQLAENAQDLIYRYEFVPQPGFTYISPAAFTITGYTPEELYNDPQLGLDLIQDDDRSSMETAYGEAAPGHAPPLRWVRKDGQIIWLEHRNVPVFNAAGEQVAIEGIARDISERVRADAELREARDRLQQAASAGSVGLWDWDLRTNHVYYSLEWKQQIGYEDDEISEDWNEWQSRLHPEDRTRAIQTVQALLAAPAHTMPNFELEFRFRHKDGSYRHILARGSLLRDDQEQPSRMLGSHLDITELKDLQQRFLHAQKMEAMGRFAGGIAHDFNNLLTIISGMTDLALTKLNEDDPLCADLQEIHRAGERAATLTRQLLAFSRRQIMKSEVLNLNTVLADMQSMLQRMIGEDIDLTFVPGHNAGNVKADRGQIEQVVVNLAVNARDAMPDGGKLTLETWNVDLDEAQAAEHPSLQPGPHVVLAISDTGIGMDEATRTRIFEPFFTTKEEGRGTGLGLSTVYGIIKQSGGNIYAASEPGTGTTFKIYLPRVEEAPNKAQPARSETVARGAETILVVEDDDALRDLARRILGSAGYAVLTAGNGEEALRLLDSHQGPIHLLLTDVVMPGMSGRDLAERLTDLQPQMKVLYTSGYTDDAILRHGVLDESVHFIHKPYTMAELGRKVRETLDAQQDRPTTA